MNTTVIYETSLKVLAGTASFPQAVGAFISAGVEYYRVDYVALTKTYYGTDGTIVTARSTTKACRLSRQTSMPRP